LMLLVPLGLAVAPLVGGTPYFVRVPHATVFLPTFHGTVVDQAIFVLGRTAITSVSARAGSGVVIIVMLNIGLATIRQEAGDGGASFPQHFLATLAAQGELAIEPFRADVQGVPGDRRFGHQNFVLGVDRGIHVGFSLKRKNAHAESLRGLGWKGMELIEGDATVYANFVDVVPDVACIEMLATLHGCVLMLALVLRKQTQKLVQADPADLCSAAFAGGAGFVALVDATCQLEGFVTGQAAFAFADGAGALDGDFVHGELLNKKSRRLAGGWIE
jgi:hypothetical protein